MRPARRRIVQWAFVGLCLAGAAAMIPLLLWPPSIVSFGLCTAGCVLNLIILAMDPTR